MPSASARNRVNPRRSPAPIAVAAIGALAVLVLGPAVKEALTPIAAPRGPVGTLNLNRVLRGHYAYYGIAGNIRALQKVHRFVERYWRKMLCSRSRKGNVPWEVFHRIKERFPLQRPRLAIPYGKLQSFAVL